MGMTRCSFLLAVVVLIAVHAAPASAQPEISILANDVAFNSQTGMLYASVPSSAGLPYGNRLVEISMVDGAITRSVFVGSEPGPIGMSPDAAMAYVGLNGAAAVRPVDLTTMTAGTQFSLGGSPGLGTYYPERLAVMPGSPDVVAVTRTDCCGSAGVAIFKDGVALPNSQGYPYPGSSSVAFGSQPTTLYGYDNDDSGFTLSRMQLDADGIASTAVQNGVLTGYNVFIVSDGDIVISTGGGAADGLSLQRIGTYTLGGNIFFLFDAVVADHVTSSVVLVAGNVLHVFDRDTYLEVNTVYGGGSGAAKNAVSCGAACVAVLYGSQIIVVRDVRDIFSNGFE